MRTRNLIASAMAAALMLSGCSTTGSEVGQPSPELLYELHCAACHGDVGQGTAAGSELVDLRSRFGPAALSEVIDGGIGTMPGMPSLSSEDVDAIVKYLLEEFSGLGSGTPNG